MLRSLGGIILVILLVTCCYAAVFGTCEVLGIPFRQLGLAWQVPNQWLHGRSSIMQTLIWGVCLGPGFITRNPYAGIWVLPLLLILTPNWMTAMMLGIAVGFAHGCGRAIGVLKNQCKLEETCSPMMIVKQMRWKFLDGCALLIIAGGLTVYILLI